MQRPPQYDDEVVSQPVQIGKGSNVVEFGGGGGNDSDDDMWNDAVESCHRKSQKPVLACSAKLRIGYGRASRLIDMMEEQGLSVVLMVQKREMY